ENNSLGAFAHHGQERCQRQRNRRPRNFTCCFNFLVQKCPPTIILAARRQPRTHVKERPGGEQLKNTFEGVARIVSNEMVDRPRKRKAEPQRDCPAGVYVTCVPLLTGLADGRKQSNYYQQRFGAFTDKNTQGIEKVG